MNTTPPQETPSSSSEGWLKVAAILLLVIVAALLYAWWQTPEHEPRPLAIPAQPSPSNVAPPPAASPAPPTDKVLPPPAEPPLPSLDDSDRQVMADLGRLFAGADIKRLLLPGGQLLRKAVIIIDNLPDRRLPVKYLPVRPPSGRFQVKEQGGRIFLDPVNYGRYRPYMQLLEALKVTDLIAFLNRYQPLFQAAYEELGYPESSFEGRLIAVIEDLLQTPEIEGPIELVQPSVYYKYADPALESLSSGQKLLLRMGPANSRRVKDKLRQVRAALRQP